jgi:MerR-like DNA binding protein
MLQKKVLDPGTNSRLYNPFRNDDSRKQDPWRIGKLAAACGVSADTLRHYERKGVLKWWLHPHDDGRSGSPESDP